MKMPLEIKQKLDQLYGDLEIIKNYHLENMQRDIKPIVQAITSIENNYPAPICVNLVGLRSFRGATNENKN